MDPVTQGVLGGVAAAAGSPAGKVRPAAAVGVVGGMLADADVFIQSASDPLLQLEFHRQFSHSLIFTPAGGLLAALIVWPLMRRWLTRGEAYIAGFLGYLTAGPLDACTSYGVQLLWPFTDERTAWGIVPVMEPVTTLLLLLFLYLGWKNRAPGWARMGLITLFAWFGVGLFQHQRAEAMALAWAAAQGDAPQEMQIKPTMGNLALWRGVYKAGERIQSVALRPGWWGPDRVFPGVSATVIDPEKGVAGVSPDSVLGQDVKRFARLSDGYLIRHPNHPQVIGDARYAMLPRQMKPLWGIVVDPGAPDKHAPFGPYREWTEKTAPVLWAMLTGEERPPPTQGPIAQNLTPSPAKPSVGATLAQNLQMK